MTLGLLRVACIVRLILILFGLRTHSASLELVETDSNITYSDHGDFLISI